MVGIKKGLVPAASSESELTGREEACKERKEGSKRLKNRVVAYIQSPSHGCNGRGREGESAIGLTMGCGLVGAWRMGSMFVGNAKRTCTPFEACWGR